MQPEEVAEAVTSLEPPHFVERLRVLDAAFQQPDFEDHLADALRSRPDLVKAWGTWSADQRWTPSAYVEGLETGWFDGTRRHVRQHRDEAAAVADFVHRLAMWLAQKEILKFDS